MKIALRARCLRFAVGWIALPVAVIAGSSYCLARPAARDGEPRPEPAAAQGILEDIRGIPDRLRQIDRAELRSRIEHRVQRRIAEYRSRIWVAPGGSWWFTSYEVGYLTALRDHKMLVVYFAPDGETRQCDEFEMRTLADRNLTLWLAQCVCVRVPVTQPHIHGPAKGTLVSDPAFVYLEHKPGLAVIDLVGDRPELHSAVTFTRPFDTPSICAPLELATILGLPRATITQRAMIYAVRMHPEHPRSAEAEPSSFLLEQAALHSQYQASIRLQGHHNWDTRFHQISNRLGSVYSAQEVVAESWGHEKFLDAALECVHSWRQSSGHWSAVQAPHAFYGYDMKQGADGKWYGTGIFGNDHGSSAFGG